MDLVKSETQPTAVAPQPKPRTDYELDVFFLIHISNKGKEANHYFYRPNIRLVPAFT